MEGKVALITGGARGIGRAAALDLAAQGWSVVICYRTSSQQAEEVIAAIEKRRAKGWALQCDISDSQAAVALVQRTSTSEGSG